MTNQENARIIKLDYVVLALTIMGFILCFVDVFNAGSREILHGDLMYKGIDIGDIGYGYFIIYFLLFFNNSYGLNILLNLIFTYTVGKTLFVSSGFYGASGFVNLSGHFTFWFYPYILIIISLIVLSFVGYIRNARIKNAQESV